MRFNEKSLGHANLYEGQDDGGGSLLVQNFRLNYDQNSYF